MSFDARRFCWDLAAKTIDDVWIDLMRRPGARYLYFTPSTDTELGRLHIIQECDTSPAGAQLAWTERLPMDRTRDQLVRYVAERIGDLPLLPRERV